MTIHNFSNHIIVSSGSDVDTICQPLYEIGISLFIYVRIYSRNERIFLSNNPAWNENYLTKFYKLLYFKSYYFEEKIESNLLILPEFVPHNPTFKDARDIFTLDNGFVLSILNQNYKEICYFGSKKEKLLTHNYYLQNLDLLERFVCYFKEKAKPLINLIDRKRLKTPQAYLDNMLERPIAPPIPFKLDDSLRKNFLLTTQSDHYYLLNDKQHRYLTRQEYECIQWLIKGKSAEEIGMIMQLSKRTVENYLENAKKRFNCTKLPQFIYQLTKLSSAI